MVRKTDISEYLTALKDSSRFGPQVVCHKKIAPCAPEFAHGSVSLSEPVKKMLERRNQKLYSHQYQGIEALLKGKDILVATPTASGKSMIYNLAVLNELALGNPSHFLYLFPLKALAQDQKKVLEGLGAELEEVTSVSCANIAALFDGDTSSYKRRKIRDQPPAALITNPEMLHLSLLAYHQNWSSFFQGLKYVIIDEVHSYRGVVGSHMSWILRRLQRIAAHYGAAPVFIMLSATIGNPEQLGEMLLDRKIHAITESGAPQAEKNMVFINPWDSAAHTASQLLEAAVKRELRTIVYTGSRKMTELIKLWTDPRLGDQADKVSAYRAGFLPEERREIEAQLFSGELLGVISTSALELGIDIGDLDLCILVGYPGSVMATWQRGGRVGRSLKKSAIILIAQQDALDQHFMRDPEDFFSRDVESAVLNPLNLPVTRQHLLCCGAELPLRNSEIILQGSAIKKVLRELVNDGLLLELSSGNSWLSPQKYPQRNVTLRGGGSQMAIIDSESGEIIGEIDADRAMKECHPGSVYLHRARTWVVMQFSLENKEIAVRREKPNYYTRPTSVKQTEILQVVETRIVNGARVSFGRVRVREKVTGYQKKDNRTQRLISTTPLDLPERIIETEGVWIDIPAGIVEAIEHRKLHFMGAIHAMEHAMIALFPLLVLCDRNDIGGISCPVHHQTESASVFVYDGYAGGVGLAREAFDKFEFLLTKTLSTVAGCPCDTGCPSCVHSPKCGSGNRPIDKEACLILLQTIIDNDSSKNPETKQEKSVPPPLYLAGDGADSLARKTAEKNNHPKGLDALPARYGVFDLETIRSAEEVGGWNRIDRMGMSVAVVYDSMLDDFVTYLEDETNSLIDHLFQLDLVVGFNNKRFDNRVLSVYTTSNLHTLPSLDLLEQVQLQLGYRLKLNSLAEHTLGTAKSGDGLQALRWYKQGKIDQIVHYCKKDVEITKNLFLFGLEHGHFLFANKAGHQVRLPLALDTAIAKIIG